VLLPFIIIAANILIQENKTEPNTSNSFYKFCRIVAVCICEAVWFFFFY